MLALEKVIKNEILGKYADSVPTDDISVIFIGYENDEKTRRIFNKVNRYAKPTSRGDNIITSEDDAFAIIARRLLDHGSPLDVKYAIGDGKQESVVVWKHNTLADRSAKFTTISAIYETVKMILKANGMAETEKLDPKFRPTEPVLDRCFEAVQSMWTAVLAGVAAYKKAMADPKIIPEMREASARTSLLFKPAGQIALFDGLAMAHHRGVPLQKAVQRINAINWSMEHDMWRDVIIKATGNIDVSVESRARAATLIAYLIGAEKIDAKEKVALWREFNHAKGIEVPEDEDLPKAFDVEHPPKGMQAIPLPEPADARTTAAKHPSKSVRAPERVAGRRLSARA